MIWRGKLTGLDMCFLIGLLVGAGVMILISLAGILWAAVAVARAVVGG